MRKLLLPVGLIVTASISIGWPAAAEWRLAGPLSNPFATDVASPDAVVVLVAGRGGGMGGGATTGGMGGGATTGGMGGGATTGGMGGGATTGGMGGGATTGGMGSGATTGAGNQPGNSAKPAYYTYECVTARGQCHFAAPASLRSSSLRAGTRCSCADGQRQGQLK
jgi:hypothetical protein